jgi:hydroxyacylglutathione hydrolase
MYKVINCKVLKNFVYVVYNAKSKQGLIIDPSWDFNLIDQKIIENCIRPRGILITHAHIDHINQVDNFEKKYSCPVYVGEPELGINEFHAEKLYPLSNEDELFIGDIRVKPFLTPGHTPGSICYLIGDNLFTGDTLFSEGCGMCFENEGNPGDMYRSLEKLKQDIPMETKVYPGHSFRDYPGKMMKELLQNNIYLNFKNEERFIAYRMRKNQIGFFNFA